MSNDSCKRVTIYTDGACLGNPGPGGWAAILACGPHRREIAGGAPRTTNNRMELTAVIRALRTLKRPCEVDLYADSQYVVRGMTEWLPGWRRRRFKNVKNLDLWEQLLEAAAPHRIRWRWVRGHAGHPENERCDRLARREAERYADDDAPAGAADPHREGGGT